MSECIIFKATLRVSNCKKKIGIIFKSNDAKGNGALKLGTSKKVGSFSITVPSGVTTVNIYVAGYKATAAKFSINGGATQTTTKLSNNGEYDCIAVTVPIDGKIAFTTVSGGVRAMISKIEFVGIAA